MSKKKSSPYMTSGEKAAGTVLLGLYLVVLPFASAPIFDLLEKLLDADISQSLRAAICVWGCAVAALLIFCRFLGRTAGSFVDNLGISCQTILVGLVGVYGLNELVWRLGRDLPGAADLNDRFLSGRIPGGSSAIMAVLLIPFVEEVLFRGLICGNLKSKSRPVAYGLSCGLFALLHLWAGGSVGGLLPAAQYLVPAAVLTWAYDRSGSVWTSFGIHALFNALLRFL